MAEGNGGVAAIWRSIASGACGLVLGLLLTVWQQHTARQELLALVRENYLTTEEFERRGWPADAREVHDHMARHR